MSELEIALFVLMFGAIGACIAAGTGVAFLFSQRLTRVEAVIIILSEKAASILHSPHTPELDSYIEKDEAGLLTEADIPRYIELLHEIESDRDEPKGNRLAAVLTHIKVARKYNLAIPPINGDMLIKKGE